MSAARADGQAVVRCSARVPLGAERDAGELAVALERGVETVLARCGLEAGAGCTVELAPVGGPWLLWVEGHEFPSDPAVEGACSGLEPMAAVEAWGRLTLGAWPAAAAADQVVAALWTAPADTPAGEQVTVPPGLAAMLRRVLHAGQSVGSAALSDAAEILQGYDGEPALAAEHLLAAVPPVLGLHVRPEELDRLVARVDRPARFAGEVRAGARTLAALVPPIRLLTDDGALPGWVEVRLGVAALGVVPLDDDLAGAGPGLAERVARLVPGGADRLPRPASVVTLVDRLTEHVGSAHTAWFARNQLTAAELSAVTRDVLSHGDGLESLAAHLRELLAVLDGGGWGRWRPASDRATRTLRARHAAYLAREWQFPVHELDEEVAAALVEEAARWDSSLPPPAPVARLLDAALAPDAVLVAVPAPAVAVAEAALRGRHDVQVVLAVEDLPVLAG